MASLSVVMSGFGQVLRAGWVGLAGPVRFGIYASDVGTPFEFRFGRTAHSANDDESHASLSWWPWLTAEVVAFPIPTPVVQVVGLSLFHKHASVETFLA